ncbi:very short patch repair endonuclease [Pontibacter sp. G13]|uniref:very short patch repair endonuclease n=1 Tax=Pontibacter sp. G13 TaxID=3074898 RepID=UPI00288BA6ED|nr:very short patch repair endonuclease [Pontibacter sp. G13]WNJ21294.1 very short patch repair endonuclease [Pontibacter sp. G13]
MTDKLSPAQRSRLMGKVKRRDTIPELLVRKYLHAAGYRFRVDVAKLPGRPDIVMRKFKTAIFIHGCFWHGHENCSLFKIPKTRTDWWQAKIDRNRSRDAAAIEALREEGWRVWVIWECELKKRRRGATLHHLLESLVALEYPAEL